MTVGDRDGVTMSAGGAEARRGIRWTAVLAVFALGGVLVGLGIVADVRWGWSTIWPSVFLEVGARRFE